MSEAERPRGILFVLGALTAFAPLSIDMYLPALPAIQKQLHTTDAATQRTLSAYFIGLAASQIVYGPIADRWGRRKPLFFGLSLYALASLGASFAPSITILAIMRVLQAMGGAAGMVVTRAIIRDLYSGRAAANALSTLILIMGAAPIFAPLLGGALLDLASWRAIFVFLASCGVLGLIGVFAVLPETGVRSRSRGIVRTYWSLLGDRSFIGYALTGGFGNAALFAYIAGYPFVVMKVHHVSSRQFGWWFGANAFAYIASTQVNRLLLLRMNSQKLLALSTGLATVFGVAIWFIAGQRSLGLWPLAVVIFLFVASLGLTGPNATALSLEEQPTRAGAASALLGTLQFTIAAIASWLVGVLGERSARPMATVMLACVCVAFVARRMSARTGFAAGKKPASS